MEEQAVGLVIKNVLMAFSMGLVVIALILSVRSYARGAHCLDRRRAEKQEASVEAVRQDRSYNEREQEG